MPLIFNDNKDDTGRHVPFVARLSNAQVNFEPAGHSFLTEDQAAELLRVYPGQFRIIDSMPSNGSTVHYRFRMRPGTKPGAPWKVLHDSNNMYFYDGQTGIMARTMLNWLQKRCQPFRHAFEVVDPMRSVAIVEKEDVASDPNKVPDEVVEMPPEVEASPELDEVVEEPLDLPSGYVPPPGPKKRTAPPAFKQYLELKKIAKAHFGIHERLPKDQLIKTMKEISPTTAAQFLSELGYE